MTSYSYLCLVDDLLPLLLDPCNETVDLQGMISSHLANPGVYFPPMSQHETVDLCRGLREVAFPPTALEQETRLKVTSLCVVWVKKG